MRAFINIPQGKEVKLYNRVLVRGEAQVSKNDFMILRDAGVIDLAKSDKLVEEINIVDAELESGKKVELKEIKSEVKKNTSLGLPKLPGRIMKALNAAGFSSVEDLKGNEDILETIEGLKDSDIAKIKLYL